MRLRRNGCNVLAAELRRQATLANVNTKLITRALFSALCGAIVVGGCAKHMSDKAANICVKPPISTTGWQRTGGSAFHLLLPATVRQRGVSSIDSEAGGWESSSMKLHFDYGAYSNPLTDDMPTTAVACSVSIGGHPARIVAYQLGDSLFVAGVHWADLGETALGKTMLTIMGNSHSRAGLQELLASFWTVRFTQQ